MRVDSTKVVGGDDNDDGGDDHNDDCFYRSFGDDDTGPGRTLPAMALARGPDPRCC